MQDDRGIQQSSCIAEISRRCLHSLEQPEKCNLKGKRVVSTDLIL